ncbi:MAG: hypothetical protein IJT59_00455, partial [Desulfovibrionaceae bacterium]|nr:hypothetical protein [Desulfovibrionaceae bacterium]
MSRRGPTYVSKMRSSFVTQCMAVRPRFSLEELRAILPGSASMAATSSGAKRRSLDATIVGVSSKARARLYA